MKNFEHFIEKEDHHKEILKTAKRRLR